MDDIWLQLAEMLPCWPLLIVRHCLLIEYGECVLCAPQSGTCGQQGAGSLLRWGAHMASIGLQEMELTERIGKGDMTPCNLLAGEALADAQMASESDGEEGEE